MTTKITSANITQSGTSGISSVAWQGRIYVNGTGSSSIPATLTAGRAYPCDTSTASGGAFTVTLPASPAAGNVITLTDYSGTWDTNNLTINPNGNKVNGYAVNLTVSTERGSINLVYVDSTQGWISYASNLATTIIPVNPLVEYLVVGAGGGGGNRGGGGGGGSPVRVAASGGSGGGGGSSANGGNSLSGAAGTSGEGNAGGNSPGGSGNFASAGGGGKGAAGTTPASTSSGGGNGGVGIEWPTGSGVYYGGGGGGACGNSPASAGTGGNGGGGNGSVHSLSTGNVTTQGTAGSVNTGGGGGGGGSTANKDTQFASGSGVVILRYPDSYAAATSTTGSPTITVSGGYRTYKFTGNGSITF